MSDCLKAQGGEEGRDESVLYEGGILQETGGAQTGHGPALQNDWVHCSVLSYPTGYRYRIINH